MLETKPINIPIHNIVLQGLLAVPDAAKGLVIFAHGSGSSRFSKRNQMVAEALQAKHFATLLFDLLTPEEDEMDEVTRRFRFDISLLGHRLLAVTAWVKVQPTLANLSIGYFGASTGGAAALLAASKAKGDVRAVVSRGGRPDLAGDEALAIVQAPTLLIVGGDDEQVIELNRLAFGKLNNQKELIIIPGATHLFEEPGKLEKVAEFSIDWFQRFL